MDLLAPLLPEAVRYDDRVRAGIAAVVELLQGVAMAAPAGAPRVTTERRGGTATRSLRLA